MARRIASLIDELFACKKLMLPEQTLGTMPPNGGFLFRCSFWIYPMTFQPVPIAPFEQLADEIPGFTSDEQRLNESVRTTIFVSGTSAASQGRASYILGDEGERLWLPNTLTCWLNDLNIITQTYEQYDPVEKLLVLVTSINGTTWCYRMGLDSWSSSSLLSAVKQINRQQLAERVQITLTPKGRATFISIACVASDLNFYNRIEIPQTDLGRKLGYTEMLDVISYFHIAQEANQADINERVTRSLAPAMPAQEAAISAVEPAPLEPLAKPKQPRRKAPTRAKTKAASTAVN